MARFRGLSIADLKKHPSLLPLMFIMGGATTLASLYCFRLATKTPDVTWTKNKEPWEKYRAKQYKLIAVEQDCEGEDKSVAPRLEDILKS